MLLSFACRKNSPAGVVLAAIVYVVYKIVCIFEEYVLSSFFCAGPGFLHPCFASLIDLHDGVMKELMTNSLSMWLDREFTGMIYKNAEKKK